MTSSQAAPEDSATVSLIPDVCAAIGFIAVNWALIERQMDNLCHVAFEAERSDGKGLKKPRALKDKFKFIRRHILGSPRFAALGERLATLMDATESLADKRHMFLHGAIESIEDSVLVFNRLEFQDDYMSYAEKFDLQDFPLLVEELQHAVRLWLQLAWEVLEVEVRPYLRPAS